MLLLAIILGSVMPSPRWDLNPPPPWHSRLCQGALSQLSYQAQVGLWHYCHHGLRVKEIASGSCSTSCPPSGPICRARHYALISLIGVLAEVLPPQFPMSIQVLQAGPCTAKPLGDVTFKWKPACTAEKGTARHIVSGCCGHPMILFASQRAGCAEQHAWKACKL